MLHRTFLTSLIFTIQFTVLLGQNIVHNIGQPYIDTNFEQTNHFNGMTPSRLNNLKGDIKSIAQFEYSVEIIDEKTTKTSLTSGTPTFAFVLNKKKEVTEEWSFRDKATISYKNFYRDFKKRQIDSTIYWNKQGSIFIKNLYKYDESIRISETEFRNGKVEQLVKDIQQQNDSIVISTKHGTEFYLNRLLVKRIQSPGIRYFTYSYYQTGELKEKRTINKSKIVSVEKFRADGNLEYELFNNYKNDTLEYSRERFLKYDQKSRKIQDKEIYKEENKERVTIDHYKYQGDLLAKLIKEEGQEMSTTGEFEYDQQGNMTRKYLYGSLEVFSYKYDSTGNWIERTHYANNKVFRITEREIKYW